MVRIEIFLVSLLIALGYAFWKGGGPERCMAAIMLSMLVLDQALHLFVPAQFASLDVGHLLIDLFAAATTVGLALVAHRFWPMVAAVFQLLPIVAHSSRAVDISIQPIAYLTMQVAASWVLPPLLVLATWRHQRRLQQSGSDRSWQISSPRYSLPKAIR